MTPNDTQIQKRISDSIIRHIPLVYKSALRCGPSLFAVRVFDGLAWLSLAASMSLASLSWWEQKTDRAEVAMVHV